MMILAPYNCNSTCLVDLSSSILRCSAEYFRQPTGMKKAGSYINSDETLLLVFALRALRATAAARMLHLLSSTWYQLYCSTTWPSSPMQQWGPSLRWVSGMHNKMQININMKQSARFERNQKNALQECGSSDGWVKIRAGTGERIYRQMHLFRCPVHPLINKGKIQSISIGFDDGCVRLHRFRKDSDHNMSTGLVPILAAVDRNGCGIHWLPPPMSCMGAARHTQKFFKIVSFLLFTTRPEL